MAPTLLSLPSELRLGIYRYLLPNQNVDIPSTESHPIYDHSIYNIRLVCHQLQNEYDHEVVKDIAKYHETLSSKFQPPIKMVFEEAQTFRATRQLIIATGYDRAMWRHTSPETFLLEIIPHIREITIQPLRTISKRESGYSDHILAFHKWKWIAQQVQRCKFERMMEGGPEAPHIVLYRAVSDAQAYSEPPTFQFNRKGSMFIQERWFRDAADARGAVVEVVELSVVT